VILDTSAILTILRKEPEAASSNQALATAEQPAISAATPVELALVAEGWGGPPASAEAEALIAEAGIEILPFTPAHAALTTEGWRRFGKGRHPAGLNLGDCFAYALARARGQPLLFKGEDFARTDVRRAV
jgi:ribonuclease VapC